ncbi:hypothetical protein Ate02nite_81130 [Paractinoplanes tereljensis]|uniref:Uncharacterized protein n=1 Tax=Paractinoplanes tereljensis TaxID=571912 RepID=A0A919TVZ2_9ACTN|nr:hypothetical protein Ate02nite_81130 [Actinoplanes tereljensis]
MGYQHRRQVGVGAVHQVYGVQQLLAGCHVEAGGRLVQQQQTRIGYQGSGDQGPAALALGQGRPAVLGAGREAEQVDQFPGPG